MILTQLNHSVDLDSLTIFELFDSFRSVVDSFVLWSRHVVLRTPHHHNGW